jgi:hypothetical protein
MKEFAVHSKQFDSANILTVEVGTNCPQGGDSGHGGRTVLRLINGASTDMSVGVDGAVPESVDSVEILLGGDTECETLLKSLEFAVEVLRAQMLLNSTQSKDR